MKLKYITDLSAADVRALLDYDPETGRFVWRMRPGGTRSDNVFNTKFGGKAAGHIRENGYLQLLIKGRIYVGHRVAWVWMTGKWPTEEIDHINMDRGDNRFCNLRESTKAENLRNTTVRKNSKTGLKGVTFHDRSSKGRCYRATIGFRREHIHLGYFSTPEEAHAAYVRAAQEHHGKFARGK